MYFNIDIKQFRAYFVNPLQKLSYISMVITSLQAGNSSLFICVCEVVYYCCPVYSTDGWLHFWKLFACSFSVRCESE